MPFAYDPNGNLVGTTGTGTGLNVFNGVTVSGGPSGSGQILTSSSTTTALWTNFYPTYQTITTLGNNTYTPTNSNVKFIRVRIVGAGGSGGSGINAASNGGGGGASGAYIEKMYPIAGYTYSAFIGTGGAGVATNSSGNAGQFSNFAQFDGFLTRTDTVSGGGAGEGAGNGAGGLGGSFGLGAFNTFGTTSAIIAMKGGAGQPGVNSVATQNGGAGGSNPLGVGGQGGTVATLFPARTTGGSGAGYGAGSGGGSANNASANGSDGVVIVEEYYY